MANEHPSNKLVMIGTNLAHAKDRLAAREAKRGQTDSPVTADTETSAEPSVHQQMESLNACVSEGSKEGTTGNEESNCLNTSASPSEDRDFDFAS